MKSPDNDGKHKEAEVSLLAPRLAKAAEISEEQARELVELIGTDWASLLREARFLKARH
ncbi:MULTISPECIES: hypothetical protein [unclassified Mesorhizobium]|uniref:hypothetical protein n=1 Tax=unclassified Mesorhizobium TaxID=325217 RepID=UPI000BB056F1|nr:MULTISPECIES: hypothetical protein [unclassified Mesorhizobium]PBB85474.1 hypothetical protein CK216_17615 [Mesorhizobium sp. WSM3876]